MSIIKNFFEIMNMHNIEIETTYSPNTVLALQSSIINISVQKMNKFIIIIHVFIHIFSYKRIMNKNIYGYCNFHEFICILSSILLFIC